MYIACSKSVALLGFFIVQSIQGYCGVALCAAYAYLYRHDKMYWVAPVTRLFQRRWSDERNSMQH